MDVGALESRLVLYIGFDTHGRGCVGIAIGIVHRVLTLTHGRGCIGIAIGIVHRVLTLTHGRGCVGIAIDVKRLLGKRFSSNNVQKDIKLLPFKVVSSLGDEPVISFQYQSNEKQFSTLEISSMVLRNLRDTAEAFLGCPIENAVIAVPACFNDSQRLATVQAANIAGLNVMRIINEPTAAAIAYGLDNIENNDDKRERRKKKKNILIFDLGSGSLDVSILIMEKGNYKVKATRGDAHLGGVDFDNKLIIHCIEELERKHNMKKGHLSSNLSPKAYAKLRTSCEKAKRVLSAVDEAHIEIDSLIKGVDFYTSITRATFEGLNKDLFEKCICTVDRCLEDANMYRSSIDDIVVIGGSARIPKVREMLHNFFEGKDLSRRINSDEAVACGAAIQAAILTSINNNVPDLTVNDITTHSLGIETPKKVLMIPRNTAIPTTVEAVVVPAEHQMDYTIKVYEGERTRIRDNNLLGQCLSSRNNAISFAPYAVYFNVDQSGIFTISVEEKVAGQRKKRMKDITRDFMPMLSRKEIKKMATDAEELKGKEGEYKQRLEAKNELESLIIQLNKSIKMSKDSHKKKIVDAIGKTMKWLENNPQAIGDEFGDQFGEHVNCLKKEWDGMLQRSPTPSTVMMANSDESGFAKLTDLARDLAKSSTESKSRTRNTRKTDVARQPIQTQPAQPDPQNMRANRRQKIHSFHWFNKSG
ncbi:heat shock cognate protein 2-like protein [Cinnamomum micranthum f. kanehirae]|uniref:Heat shock cognate protein 2-like protein n=1 Tax=Cinnamomum micranthum f. kanehirae TaxID=337451 RepID=A0A443PXW9_9MAGN|nr:heat shock cognate protein 2-like protein [Cinnamomum micranthum f. kanehirae]